ncbi:MAG: hypothetical protein RLY31_418 [Bacteroidota bacterium]
MIRLLTVCFFGMPLAVWPQQAPDICQPLNEGWSYVSEWPAMGLTAEPFGFEPDRAEPVELPHRQLLPNTAMWYRRSIRCADTCHLLLRADDGAQVWQDRRRLLPDAAGQYEVVPGTDSSILSVRVLNNAMAGGLKSACLLDHGSGEKRRIERMRRDQTIVTGSRLQELADKNRSRIRQLRLEAEESVTFTLWGDSQGGWDTFATLVRQMVRPPVDFSIGLGDLTGDGSDPAEWESLFKCMQPFAQQETPVFLLAGNHDYDGYSDDLVPVHYLRWTRGKDDGSTWFAWQAGPAAFIALDPNATFPLGFGETQLSWLAEQFESPGWQQARWRFLLVHQPPYGQGWAGYDGEECVRELVDRIAEPQRINFVCAGHIHDYERLRKTYGRQTTHLVITGGAGGTLEPPASNGHPLMDKLLKQHHYLNFVVEEDKVVVEAFDSGGRTLDRWVVTQSQ